MIKYWLIIICCYFIGFGVQSTPTICATPTFTVKNIILLEDTIKALAQCDDPQTIILTSGNYSVNQTINITRDNLTIKSQTGEPKSVVIFGDAMSDTAKVGNVLRISAKNFKLSGVTIEKSKYHLIQIAGEHGAQNPTIENCILRDSYQQMIKVTYGKQQNKRVKNGVIENCLFEYSAGIGPNWYIGGIDAHGAIAWRIKNNTFKNIASPKQQEAEHAIHFWDNSEANIIEQNRIINCDRGIGFGLGQQGNSAGIIAGNFIYHNNSEHRFADVGIALESSPNTLVQDNLVILKHNYPNAIEYRFAASKDILISNNKTNKAIKTRNSAQAILQKNIMLSAEQVNSVNSSYVFDIN